MLFLLAVVVGIILAIFPKFIAIGAYSLIPWGIVALIFGYFTRRKKEALLVGFVYGFVMSFVFMLTGYNGTRSVVFYLLPFSVMGLFGGLCGLILSIFGFFSKKLFRK